MTQALYRKMLYAATNVEPRGAVRCPRILTNTFPRDIRVVHLLLDTTILYLPARSPIYGR